MAWRGAWMVIVAATVAGCADAQYGYRKPCDEDASSEPCCPPGSHLFVSSNPKVIICAADDAGTDAP